jgi:uncharacterized protein (DUF305 family)
MNKQAVTWGIAGLLVGVLLSQFFISGNRDAGMMRGGVVMGSIDAHFIEQMIPHHQDAITMAELAKQRAKRPEIKQLADAIIVAQAGEIDQMKVWYKAWFNKEVPEVGFMGGHTKGMMHGQGGMMMGGIMGSSSDTDALKNAADFDKAFIGEMIPHHQMAVMMAQMLKASTERAEMIKLADDIIKAQTEEINQMRAWYEQWQ